MKIVEVFEENRLTFIEKSRIIEILMNDFDCAAKTKQTACKTLRVWTKNEENFEIFQENFLDFLIKISMEN